MLLSPLLINIINVGVCAGLLNPLDSPHHMRATDESPFREGVVLNKPVRPNQGSYADVGLLNKVSGLRRRWNEEFCVTALVI